MVRYFSKYLSALLAFVLFGSSHLDRYPKDYFRSPLGIPLVLAGSFAEMRSNHFHSGLDIKTNGRSGYRVYAAAEGWVSRISVASGGFGNALYVTHPNGYSTVYAHLDRFSEPFASYVRDMQYARESFAIDAFPTEGKFPLKQGDVIAFSGNSGSSSGPHLHFEVRDAKTGWPENPLLFGFDVKDTRSPRIRRVKIYAMDENSTIRIRDTRTRGWRSLSGGESALLDVTNSGGTYHFTRAGRIEASGRIGFGIQAYDYHDDSPNQLGAYRIDLEINDRSIFSSQMERFSFNLTRHINAHVDYAEYVRNRRWIQRSYVLPGNQLPIYSSVERGLLNIAGDTTLNVTYRISDAFENEVTLPFQIYGSSENVLHANESIDREDQMIARYNRPFLLERPGIRVRLAPKSLYNDTELTYAQRNSGPTGRFSPVHRIHEPGTPVQEPFTISIDGAKVPERLRDKATLARVNTNGRMSYAGGRFQNGRVEGSLRQFGDYTIAADTTAPTIKPINITPGRNMSRARNIRFSIRDNFSGIRTYHGTIDGQWSLFSFDAKTGILRHSFDGRIDAGNHTLRLEVIDQVGNTKVYETTFTT